MDQIKIGKFIAEKRKDQNFTQKQLAMELGISDKTISKWENGDRMPDVTLILKLCEILQITVNELLVGEPMDSDNFQKEVDQNVINLMKDNQKNNKNRIRRTLEILAGIIMVTVAFAGMILVVGGTTQVLFYIDYRTGLFLYGLFVLILGLTGTFTDYIKAFKVAFQQNEFAQETIHVAKKNIQNAGILLLVIGVLTSIVAVVAVFGNIDASYAIGPVLSQAILSIFYTMIGELIHIICILILSKKS